jgi:hypothetical protein
VIRFLPFAVELVLLIFCLIDCIQTDESEIRNLRKGWWILLIIFFPLIGGIAWLVAGRPQRQRRRGVPWPSTPTAGFPEYERPRRPTGPDDDPQFLEEIRRGNSEQERLLKKWEDDLRRREQQLRDENGGPQLRDEPDEPKP